MPDALVIISTVITAIATSISAYSTWKLISEQLSAEWEYEWHTSGSGRHLELSITLRNGTSVAYSWSKVEVRGAGIIDVIAGNPPREKHDSWSKNVAPLIGKIEPGQSKGYRVVISLDWSELAATPSRRFAIKSRSDVVLRTQVTVQSRSSRRRRKALKSKMTIARQMIEQMANPALK